MAERWVLITGCSTGIGRALVGACRASGWSVVATARKRTALEDLPAGPDLRIQALGCDRLRQHRCRRRGLLGPPPGGAYQQCGLWADGSPRDGAAGRTPRSTGDQCHRTAGRDQWLPALDPDPGPARRRADHPCGFRPGAPLHSHGRGLQCLEACGGGSGRDPQDGARFRDFRDTRGARAPSARSSGRPSSRPGATSRSG